MSKGNGHDASGDKAKGRAPAVVLRASREQRKPGHQTSYTQELADEICQRLAAGESLKQICLDEHMPTDSTVRYWAVEDLNGFAARYALAREALMEKWSEEIVTIADDQSAEPNDRRVRVDTRKWLMSKIAWRRYGDKLVHSGDPENPIQVMHRRAGLADMDASELAALAQLAGALAPPMIDVTPDDD